MASAPCTGGAHASKANTEQFNSNPAESFLFLRGIEGSGKLMHRDIARDTTVSAGRARAAKKEFVERAV
jgi:hypothetical protein